MTEDKMEYVFQISTGSYLDTEVTFPAIEKKLKPILEQMPVKAVIMGWAAVPELYEKTAALLAPYKTKLYLWLPVFAELGLIKSAHPLIDCKGGAAKKYNLNEGENFEFYCPNDTRNIESFYEIYDEHFSSLPIDGVFLDRIRYASFANGLSSVFSCFCPICTEKYIKAGIDIDLLKHEMNSLIAHSGDYAEMPFDIRSYADMRYEFSSPVWQGFFAAKQAFIEAALTPIIERFKEQELDVGLDLFSPFAAYFVGQDIERLSAKVDFIKPMMYRDTYAPAGLPFEYATLLTETVPKVNLETASRRFGDIIGLEEAVQNDAFPKKLPADFSRSEIQQMKNIDTPIFCGIECNRVDDIVPVFPEDILQNLRLMEELHTAGSVLSWDLLKAPEENIQAVIKHANK